MQRKLFSQKNHPFSGLKRGKKQSISVKITTRLRKTAEALPYLFWLCVSDFNE